VTKDELRNRVLECGDAIITYRSAESRKLKYNVCTLDLDNPYIATKQNRAQETEDTLLMFCWDVDAHRLMKADNVTSVVPLSSALKERAHGK
jgi:hypothetical protein